MILYARNIRNATYSAVERVNHSLKNLTEATHLLCVARIAIGGALFSHEYYNVNISAKALNSLKEICVYIGHTNKDKSLSILNVVSWLYPLWDRPKDMSFIRVILEVLSSIAGVICFLSSDIELFLLCGMSLFCLKSFNSLVPVFYTFKEFRGKTTYDKKYFQSMFNFSRFFLGLLIGVCNRYLTMYVFISKMLLELFNLIINLLFRIFSILIIIEDKKKPPVVNEGMKNVDSKGSYETSSLVGSPQPASTPLS